MNVVFDLGGVVLTWNPAAIIRSVFEDARDRALVTQRVLGDPDWAALDRGTLPLSEAIERAHRRTGISAQRLTRFYEVAVGSLAPVPETVALVEAVRTAGHPVFVLSNLHRASLVHVETSSDLFTRFDGRIVSCEVGACKPEAAIYRRLLEQFGLEPSATVFIDDMQVNLDAAATQGIRTIRFEGAESCRAILQVLGCLA